jgi:hypothetical protein
MSRKQNSELCLTSANKSNNVLKYKILSFAHGGGLSEHNLHHLLSFLVHLCLCSVFVATIAGTVA